MNEPRSHKFAWGQPVVAGIDLFNDGSHPERSIDVLLVEFDGNCVVGCLEEEITPRKPT